MWNGSLHSPLVPARLRPQGLGRNGSGMEALRGLGGGGRLEWKLEWSGGMLLRGCWAAAGGLDWKLEWGTRLAPRAGHFQSSSGMRTGMELEC